MKCGKCSYVARDIAGMGAHYRKKHPSAMRKHTPRGTSPRGSAKARGSKFCSKCGKPL